jgi:hypothetical protein
MMMKKRLLSLLAAGLFLLTGCGAWAADIGVADAWIREAPPSAKVLAAYMVITNTGKVPVQLSGVDSRDFASVEVHQSIMHNGKMRMMALESLAIAPGKSVVLEPGGYHLMLIGPRKKLQAGDRVVLRLHFDKHEDVLVSAVVKKSH